MILALVTLSQGCVDHPLLPPAPTPGVAVEAAFNSPLDGAAVGLELSQNFESGSVAVAAVDRLSLWSSLAYLEYKLQMRYKKKSISTQQHSTPSYHSNG